MARNPRCVYTAKNIEEADIVAAWLAEQSIAALVPDRHAVDANVLGQPAYVPEGIEVCVEKEADVPRAVSLIEQHNETIKSRLPAGHEGDMISVTCEKCGETAEFPFSTAGRVAECPNCHEYLDVPPPPRGKS
jgi:ribosomal protein S27E